MPNENTIFEVLTDAPLERVEEAAVTVEVVVAT